MTGTEERISAFDAVEACKETKRFCMLEWLSLLVVLV
jgi:hypothetical protein